jgi:hypothetical protein
MLGRYSAARGAGPARGIFPQVSRSRWNTVDHAPAAPAARDEHGERVAPAGLAPLGLGRPVGAGGTDALRGLERLGVDDRLMHLFGRPDPLGLVVPTHDGLVAESDVPDVDEHSSRRWRFQTGRPVYRGLLRIARTALLPSPNWISIRSTPVKPAAAMSSTETA